MLDDERIFKIMTMTDHGGPKTYESYGLGFTTLMVE
jgi:hypothetical protein